MLDQFDRLNDVIKAFFASDVSDEDKAIILKINTRVPLDELLGGAHIAIADEGALYFELLKIENSYERTSLSSHYKGIKFDSELIHKYAGLGFNITDQYEVDIPHLGHVLFGLRPSKSDPLILESWLQFEQHGVDLLSLPYHIYDWVIHRLQALQIGPHGRSEHTEKIKKVSNG